MQSKVFDNSVNTTQILSFYEQHFSVFQALIKDNVEF